MLPDLATFKLFGEALALGLFAIPLLTAVTFAAVAGLVLVGHEIVDKSPSAGRMWHLTPPNRLPRLEL